MYLPWHAAAAHCHGRAARAAREERVVIAGECAYGSYCVLAGGLALLAYAGYPGLDVSAQLRERYRAVLENPVVKLTDIEAVAERLFGLPAKREYHEPA